MKFVRALPFWFAVILISLDANALIQSQKQKWTYIRIVDYDSLWGSSGPTLDETIAAHVPESAPSGVNYVMMGMAYKSSESAYAYVTPAGQDHGADRRIFRLPNQPANSLQTYVQFFDWVAANFPAEKYVLSFWGHGGGPLFSIGMLGYASSNGEYGLTVRQFGEMARLLSSRTGQKTSVLFLCTCVNSALENAFELTDSTEFFVAGETVVGCMLEPFNVLQKHQDLTSEQLATRTVNEFDGMGLPSDGITYASVRLSAVDRLVAKVRELGSALRQFVEKDPNNKSQILQSAAKADNMNLPSLFGPSSVFSMYIDLYDLADHLDHDIADAAVEKAAAGVKDSIDGHLITALSIYGNNSGGIINSHNRGLFIVHPSALYKSADLTYYKEQNFNTASGWGNYIDLLVLKPSVPLSLEALPVTSHLELVTPVGGFIATKTRLSSPQRGAL